MISGDGGGQVSKAGGIVYASDFFALTRGSREYAVGPWGNCSSRCGRGVRHREVTCRASPGASRELASGAWVYIDASNSFCLDDAKALSERVFNVWTKQWDTLKVNASRASHWAIQPHFHVLECNLLPTGCRRCAPVATGAKQHSL